MIVLHTTSPSVNDLQDGDGEHVSMLVGMDNDGPRVVVVQQNNNVVIADIPLPPCEAAILALAFTRAAKRSLSMAEQLEWAHDGPPGDGELQERLQRLTPVQVGEAPQWDVEKRSSAQPAPHSDGGARQFPVWNGLAHRGHPGYSRRVVA
jgi:hypothetical protein